MSDSFAYFHHPLVADEPGVVFETAKWLAPYSLRSIIENPHPLESAGKDVSPSLLSNPGIEGERDPRTSISKKQYIAAAEAIIESCRARSGKTVFSRIIEGRNPALSPIDAARELAATFPNAFTFLFSTPATGCWIGATPETLLNFDYQTRSIETMAYAGTRLFAGDATWDAKNLRENQYVVDHIIAKFNQLGIQPEVSAPYSSPYGHLQHLRRDISATLPQDVEYWQLLDLINPTPALCGTPTDAAIVDISRYESAPRGCYGGFVALHRPGVYFRAFACLRCARLYPDGRFEIHAGGGLTPDSTPLCEYLETESKAAPLLHIL